MTRFYALVLALCGALLWQAPARASGDFGCAPDWTLAHPDLTGCDNMAMLAPGNDTRVNLTLLMFDLRGTAPAASGADEALFGWWDFRDRLFPRPGGPDDATYAAGEGSRCRSNERGAAEFEAALESARGLSTSERTALAAARRAIQPSCTGASDDTAVASAVAGMKSPAGKAFARYLQGALAFYDGDYDRAAAQFGALKSADQPWLKETACYMLGRVEVNRAQVGAYDEYGFPADFAKIDSRTIAAAEAALGSYVAQYPAGRYAASARGLLRRVYWLGGNAGKLSAIYAKLLAQAPAARGIEDGVLVEEIDDKLLVGSDPSRLADPVLLAVIDLQRMRTSGSDEGSGPAGPVITRAELEAQRPRFAGNAALFDYLLAAHAFHIGKDPREVLRLIPDAARQARFSYLQFSRQMLRGMALEALKDRNARGFWLDLIKGATAAYQRPAVELALALHEERAGGLDRVFASDSPIRSRAIREILLMNVAGPALLRQQARDAGATRHERELALFTLLYKQLTRGAYQGFLADLALVPADSSETMNHYDLREGESVGVGLFARGTNRGDYDCPALKETTAQLARDPKAPKPLLCLADFMRTNGFDEFVLDSQPPGDQLGSTRSQFPGAPYSRLEVYKGLIADARTPAPDKAYALYRAINCYATAGNNSCGGTEVPQSTRKAWFTRLKKEYATSRWARELKYYW